MVVPKGGSCCATCEYVAGNRCTNKGFIQWNSTDLIPAPVDSYCCDLYEIGKEVACVLFQLRHGQTEANKEGEFRGWENFELDPEGVKSARKAGEWLEGNAPNLKLICCSPLKRTRQTAAIVAQVLGFDDVYVDKRLLPWNMGALAGKSKKQYAKQLDYLVENPDVKAPNSEQFGSESLNEVRGRFRPALHEYLESARADYQILLVDHGTEIIETDFYINQSEKPGENEIVGPGGILGVCQGKDGQYMAKPLFGEIKKGTFGS